MHRRVASVVPALLVVVVASTAAGRPALPPDHHARLMRGEVVVLDELPPGGLSRPDQGGTAMAVVHAAPGTVWRVLVTYPDHRGLYPRVVEATVLETEPGRTLVRYVVGLGPFTFGFHVNNFPDAARRRIDWRLDQGRTNGLFRESWGYWQLEPADDGVLVTYAMAARMVLPAFLTRGSERDALVRTVEAVRERAERAQGQLDS
jgi:ribosome-associated toxin RatA of RatAB toxin-antitoxin module